MPQEPRTGFSHTEITQRAEALRAQRIQHFSDQLFAACLHFILDRDEKWLKHIRDLSQELLDRGYETSFEHKKKVLIVKSLFSVLELRITDPEAYFKVGPRTSDLESLPNAE